MELGNVPADLWLEDYCTTTGYTYAEVMSSPASFVQRHYRYIILQRITEAKRMKAKD